MAKAATRGRSAGRRKASTDPTVSAVLVQECAGIGLLGLATLAAIALYSYAPSDPVLETGPVANAAGAIGAALAAGLLHSVGYGSLLLVAAMAVIGARLTAGKGMPRLASRFWAGAPLLVAGAATLPPLLAELSPETFAAAPGGWLGDALAARESWLLGLWGSLLLNGVLLLIGGLVATGLSTGRALAVVGLGIGWLLGGFATVLRRAGEVALEALLGARQGVIELARGVERGWRSIGVRREQRARRARVAAARGPEPDDEEDEAPALEPAPQSQTAIPVGDAPAPAPKPKKARRGDPQIVDHADDQPRDQQGAFRFEERSPSGPFRLPDISIFQDPPKGARTYDRDSLIMNSRILEKKLADFGVARQRGHRPPGAGHHHVRVRARVGHQGEQASSASPTTWRWRCARSRCASSRRCPASPSSASRWRTPSATTVVYLRDLLECEKFRTSESRLPVALGKDIFGNPVDADLAKMPHLLVAGATGTGKSVFLNALLCSILCRARPTS